MFIGPKPFSGNQICHFKERLKKWEKGEIEKYLESLPDRSQSRILINYSTKRTKKFHELSNLEMRKITGLLTGHCSLNGYLKKIGEIADD